MDHGIDAGSLSPPSAAKSSVRYLGCPSPSRRSHALLPHPRLLLHAHTHGLQSWVSKSAVMQLHTYGRPLTLHCARGCSVRVQWWHTTLGFTYAWLARPPPHPSWWKTASCGLRSGGGVGASSDKITSNPLLYTCARSRVRHATVGLPTPTAVIQSAWTGYCEVCTGLREAFRT